MKALLTENRVDGALSKIGRIRDAEDDRYAEVCMLLREDVVEALRVDHGSALDNLSAEDRRLIDDLLVDEIETLVTKRLP